MKKYTRIFLVIFGRENPNILKSPRTWFFGAKNVRIYRNKNHVKLVFHFFFNNDDNLNCNAMTFSKKIESDKYLDFEMIKNIYKFSKSESNCNCAIIKKRFVLITEKPKIQSLFKQIKKKNFSMFHLWNHTFLKKMTNMYVFGFWNDKNRRILDLCNRSHSKNLEW